MNPMTLKLHVILECQEKSNVVSWIRSRDRYKAEELVCNRLWLVKLANANRYHWVSTEVVGTPSILNTIEATTDVNIRVRNPLDWSIMLE